jgi:hypothetical protein
MAPPFVRQWLLSWIAVHNLKIDAEGSYEAALMADQKACSPQQRELRVECVPLHL